MDNKKMLDVAIQSLQSLSAEDVESVELESTRYDDGTLRYSVDITLFDRTAESVSSERK